MCKFERIIIQDVLFLQQFITNITYANHYFWLRGSQDGYFHWKLNVGLFTISYFVKKCWCILKNLVIISVNQQWFDSFQNKNPSHLKFSHTCLQNVFYVCHHEDLENYKFVRKPSIIRDLLSLLEIKITFLKLSLFKSKYSTFYNWVSIANQI